MAKQLSPFEKEFAAARDRGDLKFKFKGKDGATKEYTTERKDEPRRTKYSTTADTAKFRAERDKPRTSMGQTGTRNFSSSPSSSKPEAEDGTRKALKDLSARTSPRELGKIPPRKYSAGEVQNMASREADRKGSLANQYRKESRMKDLDATAAMMGAVAGAPAVTGAFKGATIPELMKDVAGTIPGKVVNPARVMGEKASRRASDIYGAATGRGYKKGGNVKKAKESKAMVKKEASFFKKKGAPKSMIKHEEKEAKDMKRGGGKVMKFAKGGSIDGCAIRGKTKLKRVKM